MLNNSINDIIKYYYFINSSHNFQYNLYYPKANILYNYIPKNGCSSIKLSFASYESKLNQFGMSIHEFSDLNYKNFSYKNISKAIKIVVIRNPFARCVSAYMEKICIPNELEGLAIDIIISIFQCQRKLSKENAKESVKNGLRPTFKEFINYLSCRDDIYLDAHFKTQCSFLQNLPYDHIISLENLSEFWKSNLSFIPLLYYDAHATSNKRPINSNNIKEFEYLSSLDPKQISKKIDLCNFSIPYNLFYLDKDVKIKFINRYYDDIFIYKELFGDLCTCDLFNNI